MSVFQTDVHATLPRTIGGKGTELTIEEDGQTRTVLDACGGAAVAALGHGNERMIAKIQQAAGLPYILSHGLGSKHADDLAKYLVEQSPEGSFSSAVFLNSGSEANEAALKLSKQYFVEKNEPKRVNYISRHFSYHGSTLGVLSLGGFQSRRKPYADVLNTSNFHKVSTCFYYRGAKPGQTEEEYTQQLLDELDAKFQHLGPETVISFTCETVIGATLGCVPPTKGYIKGCRDICHKYGALFVLDEVMSGMGRCGTYHAWQHEMDEGPDLQPVAKVLGGGYVPLAAVLISPKVYNVFKSGSGHVVGHQTYQDHIFATSVGLELQKIIKEDQLVERSRFLGLKLEKMLNKALANNPNVGDIRGRGLFWDVEFVQDKETKKAFPRAVGFSTKVYKAGMKRGVHFLKGVGTVDSFEGDHIILSPPYTVSEEELTKIVDVLKASVEEAQGESL
jgi:adenosylmethionine-8-amino-7-oxononanoate aminotransferase